VDYKNTRSDHEKSAAVHKGLAVTKVIEQNDQNSKYLTENVFFSKSMMSLEIDHDEGKHLDL
jgi:hypothetical protein